MEQKSAWNTLEISELALQTLTPIIVVLIGFLINITIGETRIEQKLQQEEKIDIR